MRTSPTQRTLKFLRAAGYTVAITERWNPHARIRQDLFNFVDVLAIKAGEQGALAVQTCAGAGGAHAERRAKILALPVAKLWAETGGRIWVISWAKRSSAGRGSKKVWAPRIEKLEIGMFPDVFPEPLRGPVKARQRSSRTNVCRPDRGEARETKPRPAQAASQSDARHGPSLFPEVVP